MRIEIDLYPILLALSFIGSFFIVPLIMDIVWSKTCKMLTLFGFGILWVHIDDQNYWLLQDMRKRTVGHHGWFITAPKWFNVHVWNVGGKK